MWNQVCWNLLALAIDLENNENLLELQKIDIGFQAVKHLKNVKDVSDLLNLQKQCQIYLVKTIKKLQERSLLKFKAVAQLSFLNSEVII